MTSLAHEIEHLIVPPRQLMMRDISSWNGVPDIPSLGADIISVKFTEGTGYLSPVAQRDWLNVKAAGKGRMAYHYFHPSVSARAQARYFLDNVKTAGLETGDCLAIDLEESDGMNAAEVASAAVAFKNEVQAEVKCSLIVYTYLYFARSGNCMGLGHQPLWIAEPSAPKGHPDISGTPWEGEVWTFHQYGTTRGIADDLCNFTSMDTYFKFAVLPTPPPLAPNQVMVELTDGKLSTSSLLLLENIREGLILTSGDAVFKVTEDGLPGEKI